MLCKKSISVTDCFVLSSINGSPRFNASTLTEASKTKQNTTYHHMSLLRLSKIWHYESQQDITSEVGRYFNIRNEKKRLKFFNDRKFFATLPMCSLVPECGSGDMKISWGNKKNKVKPNKKVRDDFRPE